MYVQELVRGMMAIISVTNDVAQQRNNSQVDGCPLFIPLYCRVWSSSSPFMF